MAGKVWSQAHDEPVVCGEMGIVGILLFIALIPLSIYSPLSGMIAFGLLANYLRQRVVAKYNVEEHNYFCCGCLNPCLNFFHNACNYPCSLFQMKMAMEEWDAENPQVLSSVVAPSAPPLPQA
jgi:hypothetical protein